MSKFKRNLALIKKKQKALKSFKRSKKTIQLKYLKESSLQKLKKEMFLGKDKKDAHSTKRKIQLMNLTKLKTFNQTEKQNK